MEKLLSNEEFNALLKDVELKKGDVMVSFLADPTSGVDEALKKLKVYWKIIKPILKVAKLITPRKIDKAIDEFIGIVNKLVDETTSDDEESELLLKFALVWGTVKPVLVAAKGITPPKADAIIDEIIKVGDLLAKS